MDNERIPLERWIAELPHGEVLAAARSVDRALHRIPTAVRTRGRPYAQRVGKVRFHSGSRLVEAPIQGSDTMPYLTTLEVDVAWEPYCSCPASDFVGPCKHGAALLAHVSLKLRDALLHAASRGTEDQRAPGAASADANHAGAGTGGINPAVADLLRRMDGARREADKRAAAASALRGRLHWRVGFVQGTLGLDGWEVYEEGSGRQPRRLGVSELRERAREFAEHAEPELPAVLAHATVSLHNTSFYGFGASEIVEHARALDALAGCDRVRWTHAPERAVAVHRRLPVLSVEPSDQPRAPLFFRARLEGMPVITGATLCSSEDRIVIVDRQRDAVWVVPTAPALRSILLDLLASPMAVTAPDAAALLTHAIQLGEGIAVAVDPTLVDAERATAFGLVLRLTPRGGLGEGDPSGAATDGRQSARQGGRKTPARPSPPAAAPGIVATLLVRLPDAPHIPPEPPGAGQEALYAATCDGRFARLTRTPAEEERAARALAETLGFALDGAAAPARPFTWEVTGLEASLELVARARALEKEGAVVVEAAGGLLPRVVGHYGPKDLRVSLSSGRDWFGIEGGIEVDGATIGLATLLAALRDGQRFVALGGNRFAELSAELRRQLAPLDAAARTFGGRVEVSPAAAPAIEETLADIQIDAVSPAWKLARDRYAASRVASVDPPLGLQAELRGYQREGYAWLKRLSVWGVGGCLADDMGLGKTVQSLALLLDRAAGGPQLVVAPTSVGAGWVREAGRFAPSLEVRLYREKDRHLEGVGPGTVVVTSFAIAARDIDKLGEVPWATLVVDEAQRAKNAATKTARALAALPADFRLALTGTPIENHLGELWSIYRLVEPGLFGSWQSFRERFADPIERDRDPERRALLAGTLRPLMLRRRKSEVLSELPPRQEMLVEVELSHAERDLYEQERRRAVLALTQRVAAEPDRQRFAVLAAITRLRQLACHPRLVDPRYARSSAKLARLVELVEDLRAEGHRALIFSQFTSLLALVREALDEASVRYLYLDGSTPERERARQVDAFQAGEGEVFLISLKAGGAGLNLTGANHVIHLDPWWNPAVEDQASDRAHRIGQTQRVTVLKLVTKGTIEEEILALHATKRELVASVLDGAEGTGKLSTDELLDLIRKGAGFAGGGDADDEEEIDDEEVIGVEDADEDADSVESVVAAKGKGKAKGKKVGGTGGRAGPAIAPKGAASARSKSPTKRPQAERTVPTPAALRAARLAAGLTQSALASLFGMWQAQISSMERGRSEITQAVAAWVHAHPPKG